MCRNIYVFGHADGQECAETYMFLATLARNEQNTRVLCDITTFRARPANVRFSHTSSGVALEEGAASHEERAL